MTGLQMLWNIFCEMALYRRTKDLVPLFDPKVHLFENSLLKMLAQLHVRSSKSQIYILFQDNTAVLCNCPSRPRDLISWADSTTCK